MQNQTNKSSSSEELKSTGLAVEVPAPVADPVRFARELSGEFNDKTVCYTAIAGETYILDEKAAPAASFFTVAYLKRDVDNDCARPVTFVFNGGPGSSAQWLHMGVLGPKRIRFPIEPENTGAPPYPIADNTLSILDVTDLVFIDPVGTGYSRTLGSTDARHYWGLLEDARSVADFIQSWITDNRRWNSPRFLVGESYGTTRAALVAEILSDRYITVNGAVLVSAVLDYQNSRPRAGDGGVLSYVSFLPSYAAVAWYHNKVSCESRSLESLLNEVRTFARTDYAQALIANHRLSGSERARLILRVSGYTGLAASYVDQSNLRIPVDRFFKELLRDNRLVIGRLDGRYTYVDAEGAGEQADFDPAVHAVGPACTVALNAHLAALGVRMQRPYVSLREIGEWNWLLEERVANGGGYVNVIPRLGRAMRRNKDFRVLLASGYYDLATPFFGAENALSQDSVVHDRIECRYYEVGHVMFLHEPSRLQFLNDVRRFIENGGDCDSAH